MRKEEINELEYSLEWMFKIARLAKHYQLGNCCEKTCVAYEFLYQLFLTLPEEYPPALELYNDPFNDHFFLVVGRNEKTEPGNPLSWNKDTVICDPWAESQIYTIEMVNFSHINSKQFYSISNLYSFPEHEGTLILEKEILLSALDENVDENHAITIPIFVRRNRIEFQEDSHIQIYNQHIPMVIEPWHLPEHNQDLTPRFR